MSQDHTATEKVEPIEIPGLPGKWRQIEARYDYKKDKVRCPNCGGLGIPWGGWFSCDTACQCVAVVADGRAFMPIKEMPDNTTTERPDVLVDVLASLVAAVSLLKCGSKKAAPSDRMFDQMIADYERSIERGRAALKERTS